MRGTALLRRFLYRWGWDTRCRNLSSARLLRQALADASAGSRPALLDVGCGRAGLAAYLRDLEVVGVDIEPPEESLPNLVFRQGTITRLPFPDQSFPLVSCVDVLEHLPLDARAKAVDELVRVARDGVLIACPHGATAQSCDTRFKRALDAHGRPVPAWLSEHRAQPYPTVSAVAERIRHADREVTLSVTYSEPALVCRIVRAVAARSSALYAVVNLFFGAFARTIPEPGAANSYRMLLFARLGPRAGSQERS
jgi:SAM-dependent methyltransferase